MKRFGLAALAVLACVLPAVAGEVTFSNKPIIAKDGDRAKISFAVSAPTDVEVAILDSTGKAIRHLAAGVLGGPNLPPSPLAAGLKQELTWDGKDDFGKPALSGLEGAASGGPFKVRVRAGTGLKFGRFIGANPLSIGLITGVAADPAGNVYVLSHSEGAGNFQQIVKLDPQGNYAATILPFPANLPADRIADWAHYDGAPRPTNRNGLGPEFYIARYYGRDQLLSLQGADAEGLLLTDNYNRNVYRIAFDGGEVGGKFIHAAMWPQGKGQKPLPNSGNGPIHIAATADGKYLYLSGPFSATTMYGYKAEADSPPGRVYRMELGKGPMEPFATLPVAGQFDIKLHGWSSPTIADPAYFAPVPHGPIHAIVVDGRGNVLVADQDGQRVAVFDPAGKEVASLKVAHPDLLALHPKTGALYVLCKEIQKGSRQFKKTLLKFNGWKDDKPAATLELGADGGGSPSLAVAAAGDKTVLWLGGGRGGLLRIEDKGDSLAAGGTLAEKIGKPRIWEADRLAVDRETDTLYINDTGGETLRFSGLTGEGGEIIRLEGKDSASDLSVGPDGYIYAQTANYTRGSYVGSGYSGPLGRYGRDLKPAPYPETGTHFLSKYIYGAFHGQGYYRERGIGVGRDGKVYAMWMSGGWCNYGITAWGPDGKAINGTRAAVPESMYKQGVPADLKRAIISPLGTTSSAGLYSTACVRADSQGRIYVGIGVQPKDFKRPTGFEKDPAYGGIVGSIVRFGPAGGGWGRTTGAKEMAFDKTEVWFESGPKPEGALEANGGNYFVGADRIYGGFGPLSSKHADQAEPFGHSCSCRGGRFDIDLYDRLYVPNAVTNSVRIADNNDNTICEFGAYGNFDSRWVPPDAKDGKPLVATPAIPLGWPVGVGWSERAIYVSDMYNRRVVRVDREFAVEETVPVK